MDWIFLPEYSKRATGECILRHLCRSIRKCQMLPEYCVSLTIHLKENLDKHVLKRLRQARNEKLEKMEFIKGDLLFERNFLWVTYPLIFHLSIKLYRWYARYERQLPRNFCSNASYNLIAIKLNSLANIKQVPSVSVFYVNELIIVGEYFYSWIPGFGCFFCQKRLISPETYRAFTEQRYPN